MNVVDGLKLVRHVEASSVQDVSWGLAGLPAPTDPTQAAGHRRRGGAHPRRQRRGRRSRARRGRPPGGARQLRPLGRRRWMLSARAAIRRRSDVVRTPRTGTALTLRTAIHFDPDAPANPLPAIPLTPLASAEPGLNAWLAARLARPRRRRLQGHIRRSRDRCAADGLRRQARSGAAADRSGLPAPDGGDPVAAVPRRARAPVHPHQRGAAASTRRCRSSTRERVAGRVTFFELQALIDSLHALTVASRPLQPADLARQTDARAAEQPPSTIDARAG